MYLFFFQTIWINTDSIRASMCVGRWMGMRTDRLRTDRLWTDRQDGGLAVDRQDEDRQDGDRCVSGVADGSSSCCPLCLGSVHRRGDAVELQHIELQHMELQHIELQHMELQHMEPQHIELQHMELQHIELQHMELQHIELQHMELQHMELQHIELQHMELQHIELPPVTGPETDSVSQIRCCLRVPLRENPAVPRAEPPGAADAKSVLQRRPLTWKCSAQQLLYCVVFSVSVCVNITTSAPPWCEGGGEAEDELKHTPALPLPCQESPSTHQRLHPPEAPPGVLHPPTPPAPPPEQLVFSLFIFRGTLVQMV
ncbi:uncharacterized protein V6R79_009389 [Siganus canaliculatus]